MQSVVVSSKVDEKSHGEPQTVPGQLTIPPFPYKRVFIDPEELWVNTCTLDLVPIEVIEIPENRDGWSPLPRGVEWGFGLDSQRQVLAFVTGNNCYNRINKLVDYFSEEARMKANRKGCPSPYDFYHNNYPAILEKAKKDMEAYKQGVSSYPSPHGDHLEYWVREEIYLMNKECTTFKISVTKALMKFFGSQIVLDPSAGWGDRLLGSVAAGVKLYHGVDPNPRMRKAYDDMIAFTKKHNPQTVVNVTTEDFLKIELQPESYDTVFTSPPYFDYEEYAPDPRQSISGRPTIGKWLHEFFLPYLRKAWNALVKGGHMIIYISDTKTGKFCKPMLDYAKKELHGQYLGVIAMTNETRNWGYPIWVWRK